MGSELGTASNLVARFAGWPWDVFGLLSWFNWGVLFEPLDLFFPERSRCGRSQGVACRRIQGSTVGS